jgi:hypothetical protein
MVKYILILPLFWLCTGLPAQILDNNSITISTDPKSLAIGVNLNKFDEVYASDEDVDFDIKTERAFFADPGLVYTITLDKGLGKNTRTSRIRLLWDLHFVIMAVSMN